MRLRYIAIMLAVVISAVVAMPAAGASPSLRVLVQRALAIAQRADKLSNKAFQLASNPRITSGNISRNAVLSVAIAPDAVKAGHIALDAVGADAVADGAIGSGEIADDAIQAVDIAANAIGESEIIVDAVGAEEIAPNAVGSSEIAANAVGSSEIMTDAVGAADILAGAVGSAEIADGAVASVDITDGTVASVDISDGGVASIDVLDGTLVGADLAGDISITTMGTLSAPTHTGTGAVTVSSGGGGNLTLNSGSDEIVLDPTDVALKRTTGAASTLTLNLADSAAGAVVNTLALDNVGNDATDTANLNLVDGALATAGTVRISNAGVGTFAAGTTAADLTVGGGTKIALIKRIELAVDPPDLAAQTAANMALAFPAGSFTATATIIADPANDLEADVAVGNVFATAADAATLTVHSVAAVNGASKTWGFWIIER